MTSTSTPDSSAPDTSGPLSETAAAAAMAERTWFDVTYRVRTGIDGSTLRTGGLLVMAPDPDAATAAVIPYVHAYDPVADPRVDPSVQCEDPEELDVEDAIGWLEGRDGWLSEVATTIVSRPAEATYIAAFEPRGPRRTTRPARGERPTSSPGL